MPWSHKRCHLMVGKVCMPLEDTEDWSRIVVNQGQDKTLGRCKLEDEQWLLVSLNTAEEGVARCESPERMFR